MNLRRKRSPLKISPPKSSTRSLLKRRLPRRCLLLKKNRSLRKKSRSQSRLPSEREARI